MTVDTTKLPLANSDFRDLRSQNKVYVDKTRMIYELAKSDAPIFLSRPRRFGKSLLVSTLASLFSKGLEDFKGLEIEKLWKEDKTYPVMRFDFSEINRTNARDFLTDFARVIKEVTEDYGMKTNAKSFGSVFSAFRSWLRKEPEGKYVLLIDEYDSPLTEFLNDSDQFSIILSNLSQFYATIKACSGKFRFIFCTGIARFQKASIFSHMNVFTDITLDPGYGTITGYTQEELEKYFSPYLDNAAKVLGMPREKLLDRMEEQYDGFCFDEKAKYRLYAPWSVLKFLTEPENGFKNYWIDSGGIPSILEEYFKSHEFVKPEGFGVKKEIPLNLLSSVYKYDRIQVIPLLTQTGYLTIDSVKNDIVTLHYPNREVFNSMGFLYTENIFNHDASLVVQALALGLIAEKGDVNTFIETINKLFLKIPHGNKRVLTEEALIRSHLIGMLAGGNWEVQGERENLDGSSDIVATFRDYTYVFELKFIKEENHKPATVNRILKSAVEQIEQNRYGEEIRAKKLIRLAMVFSEKERRFVKWQQVD